MTERLYYNDSYVREFHGRVIDSADDGKRVYLDRTAFYPTSGGQPFDLGTLQGVAVREVVDEDDRIAQPERHVPQGFAQTLANNQQRDADDHDGLRHAGDRVPPYGSPDKGNVMQDRDGSDGARIRAERQRQDVHRLALHEPEFSPNLSLLQ